MSKQTASTRSRSQDGKKSNCVHGFPSHKHKAFDELVFLVQEEYLSISLEDVKKKDWLKIKNARTVGIGEFDPNASSDHGLKVVVCRFVNQYEAEDGSLVTQFELPLAPEHCDKAWMGFIVKGWVPVIGRVTSITTPIRDRRNAFWHTFDLQSLLPKEDDSATIRLADESSSRSWKLTLQRSFEDANQTTTQVSLTARRNGKPV